MTQAGCYTIEDIEALLEIDAKCMTDDCVDIKGHTCYFIDFGGYFGYSVCVYCGGHQIKWANDYQLHHKDKSKEELRELYIAVLNNRLFTEAEIDEPLMSYDEYNRKLYFLMNLYPLRRKYISVYDTKKLQEAINTMHYNPVAFGYSDSTAFVKKCIELVDKLEARKAETADNYDYQKSAFYSELANHEYHINNYQGDWDTLSAFGSIEWHGQGSEARERYYDELRFNTTQRKAFEDARKDFLADAYANDWY